jgi:hypothetical protein
MLSDVVYATILSDVGGETLPSGGVSIVSAPSLEPFGCMSFVLLYADFQGFAEILCTGHGVCVLGPKLSRSTRLRILKGATPSAKRSFAPKCFAKLELGNEEESAAHDGPFDPFDGLSA